MKVKSDLEPIEEFQQARRRAMANFLESIKSTPALLGNVSLRGKVRVDWDPQHETTPQSEARK